MTDSIIDTPGITISAPSSGSGKTTFTLGLLRALRNKGVKVQAFKNGPDYIDPTFHKFASGRKSYNLDTWAMSKENLKHVISKASNSSLIINEGSMGLYDGVSSKGASGKGATSEISIKYGWPVILIIDISGQAQSSAATALGFIKFQKIPFAGVILNNVASARHESLVRLGMEQHQIEVLGSLPRQKDLSMPERHLGLVQAGEQENLEEKIEKFAELVEKNTDISKIQHLAKSNSFYKRDKLSSHPPGQRIAVAKDKAFSFMYPHIIDNWRFQGSEIFFFSPLNNEVPNQNVDFIWLPGGYPELYLEQISSANKTRINLIKLSEKVRIHGECGGYMVLGSEIIDCKGKHHNMFGLLNLVTSFEKKKLHLGYRLAKLKNKNNDLHNSKILRGHEFHYTTTIEQKDEELYDVFDANNNKVSETGSFKNKVSGTFFHFLSVGQ